MKDKLDAATTVEDALRELREMFPRKKAISITYKDCEGKMTGVWIQLGGVCCAFGPNLNSAMAQVRAWKESQR